MSIKLVGATPSGSTDAATVGYVAGFVAGYTNLAPHTPFYVEYDFVGLAYPVRPTSRTDIVGIWRGPSAPTIGGTGAVSLVDEWEVKTS